jgi:hypothetical protein
VGNGLAEIVATVYAPDGHAVADRLTALAHTVCPADPRTLAQRRSDSLGALAAGADRLGCRCGRADCPAGANTPSPVIIHVIAEQATVDGTGDTPAAMIGYEGLIPAELIAELAKTARLQPLIHPGDAPAEAGYRPSTALADFVRHRDLTCRFPNCDGGPTHASNLSCKCRTHHLAKTFWGWRDEQLRDGTLIWTSPTGQKTVTHPGSALIFPTLCAPTGPVTVGAVADDRAGDKTAKMPRRTHTRTQQRTAAILAERRANHQHHTNPPPPRFIPDEHIEYHDTFTKDPIPPPF